MSAMSAASLLILIMDILAVGALGLTGDIHWSIPAAAAIALILSRSLKTRPSNGILIAALILIILTPAILIAKMHWHPVIAVATVVPLAHSIMWFAPPNAVYRGWRIGMGFMELVLASGLTVEFYLPLAIVLFIILASVAISCDFMDRQLAERSPTEVGMPLPTGFIRRSIGLAFLIFLSAAVIFPILPRPKASAITIGATAGYTERVDLAQWSRLNGAGGGSVAMRIYLPKGLDLSTEALFGLIRSRTLEVFDGSSWFPAPHPKQRVLQRDPLKNTREKLRLEVVREPIGSDYLPAPYGDSRIWFEENDGTARRAIQSRIGDWFEPGSMNRRLRYILEFVPNDLRYLQGREEDDPPTPSHLRVPENLRTDRMLKLARSLFKPNGSPRDKINEVNAFFRREHFAVTGGDAASPNASADDGIEQQARKMRMEPVERFLFLSREGHCEWFASAAAILLRLGGVPTRLVAGFRLTTGQSGGIQTIRTGDGHAWLEAYVGNSGWVPVDPTPRITKPSSMLDLFQDLSDMLSARWYRYVVSYENEGSNAHINLSSWNQQQNRGMTASAQANTPSTNWQDLIRSSAAPILAFLLLLALVLATLYGYQRSRSLIYWSSAHLRAERRKQDRWLKLNGWPREGSVHLVARAAEARYGADCARKLWDWERIYSRLRFGIPPEPAMLRQHIFELSRIRRDLWRIQREADGNASVRNVGQR